MPLRITAMYAGILAIWLMMLAINVTASRWRYRVSLGSGGDARMNRMMRVHGNAMEYIPIALLLMVIYELDGGSRTVLHIAGVTFLAARLLHAVGLAATAAPNPGRALGMVLTWGTILTLAGFTLRLALTAPA